MKLGASSRRKEIQFTIQEAERRYDLARVADLRYGALEEVDAAIARLEGSTDENLTLTETVKPEHIAEVVSRSTGIPITRLGQNEKEKLIGLAERLHERVVGQDQAVDAVAEAVLRSRAGLGRPQQPTGSFLFLGPTGVGMWDMKEGGQLTEAVRRRPYSVVLFDEVEKAHHSVFNTLLQVLDDGRLTDGQAAP
ncbi:hypothetical protein GH714_020905 [Hevea brasiliensis]|uniref:ATPase AAA-type core domain-containing protein n=1 Tax=Hevea brasiliensis TaxID=3981 RepID=A0A6A6MGT1_HEVBR|nr:hypothetical protein GH714_020905 [Hevea brasiliensis]